MAKPKGESDHSSRADRRVYKFASRELFGEVIGRNITKSGA